MEFVGIALHEWCMAMAFWLACTIRPMTCGKILILAEVVRRHAGAVGL